MNNAHTTMSRSNGDGSRYDPNRDVEVVDHQRYHGLEFRDFQQLCASVRTFPYLDRSNPQRLTGFRRKQWDNVRSLVFRDAMRGLTKAEILKLWDERSREREQINLGHQRRENPYSFQRNEGRVENGAGMPPVSTTAAISAPAPADTASIIEAMHMQLAQMRAEQAEMRKVIANQSRYTGSTCSEFETGSSAQLEASSDDDDAPEIIDVPKTVRVAMRTGPRTPEKTKGTVEAKTTPYRIPKKNHFHRRTVHSAAVGYDGRTEGKRWEAPTRRKCKCKPNPGKGRRKDQSDDRGRKTEEESEARLSD